MTYEFFIFQIVLEKWETWLVISSWYEMTSFWYCQITKVLGLPPVAPNNLFIATRLVNIVDLTGLVPEIIFSFKIQAPQPEFLYFGTIFIIELSSVDQER